MVERVNHSHQTGERNSGRKWMLSIMAGALVGLKEDKQPINPRYLEVNHNKLWQAINNYGNTVVYSAAGFDFNKEKFKLQENAGKY